MSLRLNARFNNDNDDWVQRQEDNPGSCNSQPFASNHPGGVQFLYGDGHVEFLADETDQALLRRLASINGREVANKDD